MINSIFLFAYGTMYALGGRLLDITGFKNWLCDPNDCLVVLWLIYFMDWFRASWALALSRFLLGSGGRRSISRFCESGFRVVPGKRKGLRLWYFQYGFQRWSYYCPPADCFYRLQRLVGGGHFVIDRIIRD